MTRVDFSGFPARFYSLPEAVVSPFIAENGKVKLVTFYFGGALAIAGGLFVISATGPALFLTIGLFFAIAALLSSGWKKRNLLVFTGGQWEVFALAGGTAFAREVNPRNGEEPFIMLYRERALERRHDELGIHAHGAAIVRDPDWRWCLVPHEDRAQTAMPRLLETFRVTYPGRDEADLIRELDAQGGLEAILSRAKHK